MTINLNIRRRNIEAHGIPCQMVDGRLWAQDFAVSQHPTAGTVSHITYRDVTDWTYAAVLRWLGH